MAWLLPDHRLLRGLASPLAAATPTHDTYADARLTLDAAARPGPLSSDRAADLGVLYARLGQPEKAIEMLRAARRRDPDHFHLAANLGTAWQTRRRPRTGRRHPRRRGSPRPGEVKPFGAAHLKLVRLRLKEGRAAKDAPTPETCSG